jgi:hypothetical protein
MHDPLRARGRYSELKAIFNDRSKQKERKGVCERLWWNWNKQKMGLVLRLIINNTKTDIVKWDSDLKQRNLFAVGFRHSRHLSWMVGSERSTGKKKIKKKKGAHDASLSLNGIMIYTVYADHLGLHDGGLFAAVAEPIVGSIW